MMTAEKPLGIPVDMKVDLFSHLNRYRVDFMEPGAQQCVLTDATARFLQVKNLAPDPMLASNLVSEYLQKKQAVQRNNARGFIARMVQYVGLTRTPKAYMGMEEAS